MTYSDYCALREKLAKAENDYLQAWKNHDGTRKSIREIRKLARIVNELNTQVMESKWYR